MKRIMPTVGKIFFFLFSLAVVVFLLSLSWSALEMVFPGSLVNQVFGLANFDLAALGWLLAFIYVGRGFAQRGIAFVMFLFSLLGVGVVVALEVSLSTGALEVSAVMLPLGILLTVLTFAHAAAIYFFHLNDQEVASLIEAQADTDSTVEQARKDATRALDELRPAMARTLAAGMVQAAYRELGIFDESHNPLVIDGQAIPVAKPGQEEAKPTKPTGRKFLGVPLPGFPKMGNSVSVGKSACVWCGVDVPAGQSYCSPAHELAHLEETERKAQERMAKLRSEVEGAGVVLPASKSE